MPYYSELGIYMSPTNSYTSSYVPGPYSKHSSLLPSNFTRPPPSLIKPRSFRGYKPLLSTITENQSNLRRISSPKLHSHSSPKVIVAKPIKINTADIDVSINKYRKYERSKPAEEKPQRKSPAPPNTNASPRSSFENKDAKPNKIIRRDRPTVRLRTIHTDMVPSEISSTMKSWRDNFEPEELYRDEEKKPKKTPGELLKEKFLIRSREDIFKSPEKKIGKKASKKYVVQKNPSFHEINAAVTTDQINEEMNPEKKICCRKGSKKYGVQKTASFHDICQAITTDQINEELNPGQPIEIQRRQSRQMSNEDIITELSRIATSYENDPIHQQKTSNSESFLENCEAPHESRGSVKRKKKFTKKKSNEKVILTTDADVNKSLLQRRPTQKKIKRTSTDSSIGSDKIDVDSETEKAYQEAIRDISHVEIEKIKTKPKPIITATIDIEEKPSLKAVVDEIEIVESPKNKKPGKFKFNVIVEEIEEAKRRSMKKTMKTKIDEQKGTIHIPKPKDLLISNIVKKNHNAYIGNILEETPKDEALPSKSSEKNCKENDAVVPQLFNINHKTLIDDASKCRNNANEEMKPHSSVHVSLENTETSKDSAVQSQTAQQSALLGTTTCDKLIQSKPLEISLEVVSDKTSESIKHRAPLANTSDKSENMLEMNENEHVNSQNINKTKKGQVQTRFISSVGKIILDLPKEERREMPELQTVEGKKQIKQMLDNKSNVGKNNICSKVKEDSAAVVNKITETVVMDIDQKDKNLSMIKFDAGLKKSFSLDDNSLNKTAAIDCNKNTNIPKISSSEKNLNIHSLNENKKVLQFGIGNDNKVIDTSEAKDEETKKTGTVEKASPL